MKFSRIFATVICGTLLLLPSLVGADEKQKPVKDDPEVTLGRDGAAENDKEVKLITDPVIVDRVNKIGQSIAMVANEVMVPAHWGSSTVKKFNYTFNFNGLYLPIVSPIQCK